MKALPEIFMIFFSFVTLYLIEDVCQMSSDFKVCIDALRADPKSSSADKKRFDFDANDFPGAMSVVSGVASAPDTCEETFNEYVNISPIKSKDDDFMNFINLTASLINQFGN
ncbi:hypothetical protein R3W88_001011 [Solanum pinnatisectum]|uniref:Pectinesterase inhibitor domain-containing protein n=1 Tax=Solanum pinnatisectum TaxID=50273 RepID=A0AAV9MJZ7_9SOLN|nr:hypothetical protein R3W88_001011 [Solanum pinnatisectum]